MDELAQQHFVTTLQVMSHESNLGMQQDLTR